MKLPLSSHTAFIVARACSSASISFSMASRRPNSISSTRYTAVPACCISWIAWRLSSYLRVIFPPRKLNTRICRSIALSTTNCVWSGERVMLVGVVRDFLNSYRSVDDLKDQNPSAVGGSQGSCGRQYSRKPEVSAERTVSWKSEYYGRSRKRFGGVSREGREEHVRRGGALALCGAFRSYGGAFSDLGHRICELSVHPSRSCTEVKYVFKIQSESTSHAHCEQGLRLSAPVDPATRPGSKSKINHIDEI